MISAIKIPDSKIAREAAELVRQHESEMLFNHSVRVFLFGAMKGIRQNLKFDSELLYVAALFHDLGLADAYHTATKRFEVDGADAARAFLKSHGIPDAESRSGVGSDRPAYDARHPLVHAARDCSHQRGCPGGRRRDWIR
jgi:HD superfamily phosphodiesterase